MKNYLEARRVLGLKAAIASFNMRNAQLRTDIKYRNSEAELNYRLIAELAVGYAHNWPGHEFATALNSINGILIEDTIYKR